MRKIGWLVGLALSLAMSACATASDFTRTIPARAKLEAPGAVYVYSFLDVRENEFGKGMLAALNAKLASRLERLGLKSELLTFRESKPAESYSFGNVSSIIPVKETIEANSEREKAAGARYRLIAFPSDFRVYEVSQGFSIRWSLTDVAADRVIWGTHQSGSRTIWWSQDEDAEGRAEGIIKALFGEMAASGLIPANAFPGIEKKRRS